MHPTNTYPLPEPVIYPTRVFVGGLARGTTELELETFFSNFGPVADVRIVCDRRTGLNKGFGFITFSLEEPAKKLIEQNNIDFKGRSLRLRQAIRKKGSSQYLTNEEYSQKKGSGQWVLVPVQEEPVVHYSTPPATQQMLYTVAPQEPISYPGPVCYYQMDRAWVDTILKEAL
ncbi:predicted protein [Nematostella vectensis]|uniref:RRM domain-containing protein n=1 Tax=Nematostella vectensis TaxID=45351 RepID=A7S6X1_NEMVE|nr:predicted protein [Nematostella vectensis]|eukprot:XP_001632599.1 predicted protein [Nematostella vectensis]